MSTPNIDHNHVMSSYLEVDTWIYILILFFQVFTQGGDRPGVVNVGILLTDGIPSEPQRGIVDGRALQAKRDGIIMFRLEPVCKVH